ncbi:MAG: ABC transporter permease [Actinomycetota bacterium]|nr:ABC transporter permease [Actinomycetota bacterium]
MTTGDELVAATVVADAASEMTPIAQPKPYSQAGPVLVILAVDILAVVVFGLISQGHVFFEVQSLKNIALDGSETVLLSVGVAFLLGAGELDISLGANVILSSVVGGKVMAGLAGDGSALAIAIGTVACVLAGTAAGLCNALVVTRLRVNSFITTLATLGIMTGLADVLTNGYNISNIPLSLQAKFGTANFLGIIPYPAFIVVVLVIASNALLRRTRFGVHTLALGSSREAAVRAGLPARRNLTILFAMAGCCAGISGLIDLSRYTTTNLSGHQTDALAAIAGAVIGGTDLFGGRVSVWGAALGSLLAVVLQDGLVVVGLQAFYQLIAVGVVLVAAVSIRGFTHRDDRAVFDLRRLLRFGRDTAGPTNGRIP